MKSKKTEYIEISIIKTKITYSIFHKSSIFIILFLEISKILEIHMTNFMQKFY